MSRESIDDAAVREAAFPPVAWPLVKAEAAPALDLFGQQNRGLLEVTLINSSRHALRPLPGGAMALSYKVLDASGQVLPIDGVRTPLDAVVPAGASVSQKIAVIIPLSKFEGVTAIRVGLLHEGRHWVEQLHPGHPVEVRVTSRRDLPPAEARLGAASQIWPQGRSNGMRWPYGTMMVSERHRLLYIPVAKCACTSLKSLMVRLAGVEHADIAMELGVHFVTDRFNTGVQLKDKPIELARDILASEDYFKFSVVRQPFERLVSAYLEKFVYRRHSQRNLIHTRPVISAVQGSIDIDLQRGISFDEFASHILQRDPHELDAHWRPQNLYLRGVRHIGRVFRLENIAELERYLLQYHDVTATLGHENRTRKSDLLLPDAPTLTAAEFDRREAIDPDSFLTSRHSEALREYYREDFGLYASAG